MLAHRKTGIYREQRVGGIRSSETSGTTLRTTGRHTPEDDALQSRVCLAHFITDCNRILLQSSQLVYFVFMPWCLIEHRDKFTFPLAFHNFP
jgi:hypothetical protein